MKAGYSVLFKTGILFLTLAGVVFFAHVFDLGGILNPAWADAHLKRQGGAGVALYIGVTALLSAAGAPRQALAALGGYAFGALLGTVWASAGLIMGCAGGFFYARLLGRASVERRFGPLIRRFNAFVSRQPFLLTIALRLLPVGNNALANLAAGVSAIPAPAFIGGSGIGYLPQTVIFALLGSGLRYDPLLHTGISALLFCLASLLGLALYRHFKATERPEQAEIENVHPLRGDARARPHHGNAAPGGNAASPHEIPR